MTDRQAFWLTPLAATLPLVPLFSLPASPWFLGNMTGTGPGTSAMGVMFDGAILGYIMTYAMAVPIYFMLKPETRMSFSRMMLLFCLTGVAASQVVHALENFRQPALRAFAEGWISPLFGCLCGAVAGLAFKFLRKRKLPATLIYTLPAVTIIFCGFLLVQGARAQARPAALPSFEVASVKASGHRDSECPTCFVIRAARNGFSATNITLAKTIQWAYGVPESEIVSPSWMNELVFDIDARSDHEVSSGDLRLMVQSMLADRFRLSVHRQLRDVTAYSLSAGKKVKLSPATKATTSGFHLENGLLIYQSLTMSEFAERLPRAFQELEHRPVVDETGIEGKFDFALKLGENNVDAKKAMADGEPSIFQIISTDLGLTLKKTLQAKEIVIVDHAERMPTAN